MNEKKVRPNKIEQQSNVNKNKINKSTEIFVLSPLFLQNLGISIKDITHEEETSCVGTNKDGAYIENKQKRNYINNTSVSKKGQYDETSIVETANLMKNSVFMSPTFIPSDNNDSLVENVKPKEFDTAKNINANEELILDRNVSEDAIGVQIKTLGDVNKNDVCQKNIHDTQTLTEYASVAIVIDDSIPIGNTGPNDYASNYSTTNEQDSREMSISNDASSPCGYYIHKSNSQTQDTDIVFSQSTDIEEVHLPTNSSCYQEAINNECHQVISDEVGKKSNKENDSYQNQISYSDKIDKECTESLSSNKMPELISDNIIELNDLIVVGNNSIISNMSENGNTNECEISKLIATDIMDFEGVDNVSLQIIENEKNNHLHLGKLSNKVFSEEKQFGHINKDSCNENQHYVSVHCLYSRNKDDVDKDIEGDQCDPSSNNTKVDLSLKLHQIEKHEQSLPSSVDVNTEFCQFTTSYQNQCSKEVDVPSALAELNKRHFMDNSKHVAFVHSQVKNIENENLRSTGTVDHTEENELKNSSSSASRLNETVGENAENNFMIQETVNLPNSSTLNSCDKHLVNDNIKKTEIYTTNSDYNAPLLRDKDGIFGVSKSNDIEIKKQSRSKKAVLCGKLKGVTIKKQEMKKSHDHESENSSSAASSTHQNQCFLTENKPEKCETNVNLIATYLKQITQVHTQGPKPKSYKTSKKMVSKLSVQGVEKPGGTKLIQKQENRFYFNTSNLGIKKTYHRKHVSNKKTVVVNPIANKIYKESPCESYSLDYIEKPVSTDIKMGFCICVDYGHIFYDTSYTDLEHLHYPNKVSGDFNSHDFVTDHSIIDFNCKNFFSDETLKVSKDVTETPDPQTSSICWKNTEELIEQNKFNEALGSDDIIMSSEKFIETKVGSLNILNNIPGGTVNILKMVDSETLSQQSCCLDPKVDRTGLVYGANAFLSVVEEGSVQSSNLVHEKDPFGYEFNLTDAVHVQQERMESDDSLMLLSSELIDSSMDGKMQSTDTPDISLPVTVSLNQSPYHFMNINDEHDNKMLRTTVDDSDQNDMNTNSDQEFESQCPEFLSCDICNLNVKTEEWINHKCLSNSVHFEENGNISEIFEATDIVPKCLKKLLKKTEFLTCRRCGKNIKCAELYFMHVNKCSGSEKVTAIIYEECDEKQNSKGSVRKEKLAITPHVTEEDRPVNECTCGVCYQVIDINSWISHIQKEHDYLAWQKDETPIDFSTTERIKEHLVKISKTFGLLICKHCGVKPKRYRRSYEKYIEVYLDHVELCGNQLSQVSNVAKKIQNLSNNQDDIVTEDTNNRLSVNASRLPECDEKDFEIEENFVCGVCEQTVGNIEWANHIQTQHNYLAWKKGDTEINFNSSSSIKEHLINVSKTSGLLICKHCGLKQKRYKRSYDRYVDIYLEHVERCARRVSDVTEKMQEISGSQNSDINAESNNSLTVNDSTMSVIDAKNGEIKENIICGVCEQAVDNTEWLKHIQLQHNYLAWKKGDPELLSQVSNVAKKIQKLSNNQDDIVTENTNNRLSVNASRLSEFDEKDFEIEQNFVCGVCEQTVGNIEWTNHIQTQHNYLAWKKGDTEINFNSSSSIKEHLINVSKTSGLLICKHCGLKQKRYKRSYDRYVDIYLEHVERCARRVLPDVTEKTQEISGGQNSDINAESNNSLTVNDSTMSVIDAKNGEIKENIICGVCEQAVDNTEWLKHIQLQHNYFAWKKGDPKLDLNNSEEIESFLVELTKKIGSLSCYKCDMKLKKYKRTYENYIKSFLKHVEKCNYNAVPKEKKETLVVTGPIVICAICSHEMNQDEWNNHLLHKHYNLAWRIGLDEPLDLQNTADIVRKLKEYNKYRKMTCNNCGISRASLLGFFAHIVTCNKTEEEIAPFRFKCEICDTSSLRVYYQQHMAGHKLQEFNEEKKKLKLEAAAKEEQITETVPSGKRKAAHKAMAVLEKYTACKYKCNECEFKTDCEQEFVGHTCDVGGSCVDSEDSAGLSLQSSNESSDEEDESLSDEENQTINKKKQHKSSGHKYFTLPFNVKNVDAYLKDGCKKFLKAHYTSDTLFDEWLHCPYLEVSSDEVQKYLPPLTESCKIKFDGHWDTYKLFEARERKGYSLFMGGCISCMAWVPGPTNALQMLAVATYHSNDIPRFSYDTIHEHPGFIQIWSCGSLGNKLPDFSLGIAHDFGTVWAMEWCPSGAQTPLPEDTSYTTRLGLLAVACSNGLVYIFSVPHPSTMPSKYCNLQPVAELRFWTSSEHPNHQATAINWSKQKGHSVIAVGYSDGITAMFDLKIDSPILKHKEGNTTIFYPYSDDYSFNSSITGISIYPTMEAENTGLEVIGCSSTTGAMLQVKTAGGPAHVVHSKTAINGADFMLHWPALFISMDDITPTKPLSELEVWGLGRRAGGARVVATCTCCPRLFSWSPPLVRMARVHPLYDNMKKSPVAVIEMVAFKDEDQKPKKQKVDDDLSFKVEPTVYDDAVLKYGIRFQFLNSAKRQRIGTKPSRIARPDLYPLADVRALAVCPSPVRHNWLAIGLHAGFVFIIRT